MQKQMSNKQRWKFQKKLQMLDIKNTVTEMKNVFGSKLDMAEQRNLRMFINRNFKC